MEGETYGKLIIKGIISIYEDMERSDEDFDYKDL